MPKGKRKPTQSPPDYSSVNYGYLLSENGKRFASTVMHKATGGFTSYYFEHDGKRWNLREVHQCTNIEEADAFTEWKVPDSLKPTPQD